MAEANDNSRGLSETTPKRKDIRCKTGLSNSKHVLRKKQSLELKKNGRDIYVNNKTSFKGQLYKCEKLFDKGASELVIHGLGAAVFKAVNLALKLKEIHYGTLDLDIKTSTVTLVDELETLDDDADYEVSNRQNSGIHIRVFRRVPFAVLRSKAK
ncbi:ribonuclease P protein subunit p20 [Anoplolepis gracilipes]|uniref:ribonuclease P protein subunit p20 n=1 Tax=Anoplolepis gracilipes TaxID=354296 RepID=UPI003BA35682